MPGMFDELQNDIITQNPMFPTQKRRIIGTIRNIDRIGWRNTADCDEQLFQDVLPGHRNVDIGRVYGELSFLASQEPPESAVHPPGPGRVAKLER
uniref:Uncharacterized protein n=1 Tax=Tetraselmis sp. GSL018 TaxID=582737 RepID=A0A061QMC3_9CHLO